MKRTMAQEIKRHAIVQERINEFVSAAYTRYDSHSYTAGYLGNVLSELLTYHVSDHSREHFLGQLSRSKELLIAEQQQKDVTLAALQHTGE